MKKLNLFTKFLWEDFAKGKRFICIGCTPWRDFDHDEVLGTKVETAIIEDTTSYGDPEVTNLYEKISFKVGKDLKIPINTEVKPKGVVATVYGDYRNQLSCTAEDVIIVTKDKG